MIEITKKTNAAGVITWFRVTGHAGFAEYGQDIVCASVSVLVVNTINSIECLTSDAMKVVSDQESGLIECTLTSEISPETELLIRSMFLGLQGIEEEYGRQYIKIC